MEKIDLNHSPLGKTSAYQTRYAPELLFPIARQPLRAQLGLGAQSLLPFGGEDRWHLYELSWLTPKGKPVVAVATVTVPAESPCLVESKSFKLYLNSFNQTPFDDVDAVRACLCHDLSAACQATVKVDIQCLSDQPVRRFGWPDRGVLLDQLDVVCQHYQPEASLLQCVAADDIVTERLFSHLLKSNCPVTGQPDWGTVIVSYTGRAIDRAALLRYIVSFRENNEFHEQCVERIFIDIVSRCQPAQLCVAARYTRRGGLDINPVRYTDVDLNPEFLSDIRQ